MASLAGLSVLLIEDEFLIALDAEQILKDLGAAKVEIVATFEDAQRRAETAQFDVAVLDVNLNGQMSFPIASTFRRRGIPVVFATGYQLADRSSFEFKDAVCVGKPYTSDGLKLALLRALDGRQGSGAVA
jgi:CheY-like chemotaxis protein